MSAKIVALPGATIPHCCESPPVQDRVIAVLAELLDQARAGDIQAIAVVTVRAGWYPSTLYELGEGPTLNAMVAGSAVLHHRLTTRAWELAIPMEDGKEKEDST